jgi:alkaline phosphatase D
MAYIDEQPGPGERYWTDGWNGYPAAREQLFATLESSRVRNPVVLSGDIHAFGVASLHRVPADSGSPAIASEFTTSSISSQPVPQKSLDERRADSPGLVLLDGRKRGYLRLDATPERLRADLVTIDDVARRDTSSSVLASFVVADGRPEPQLA